jgi:hypothetical protein
MDHAATGAGYMEHVIITEAHPVLRIRDVYPGS